MDKPRRRTPGIKRPVTWATIAFILVIALGILWSQGYTLSSIVENFTWIILVGVSWALAVLLWDLAVVWIEYVSKRKHVDFLKHRWSICCDTPEHKEANEQATAQTMAMLKESSSEPRERCGLWWIDYKVVHRSE